MKQNFLITLSVVMFLLPGFLRSQESEEPPATSPACCFAHDRYQGNCVVTPAKDETCESILEYLNAPGTVGKTYCNNSRLRGGWKQVDCHQEE